MGTGNLKSLVVYVFLGIAAYMTLRGLFGAFRVNVLERATITLATGQDLPSLFSSWMGLSKAAWTAILAALLGGGLLAFIYRSKEFRSSFDYTLGGIVTYGIASALGVIAGSAAYALATWSAAS